MSGWQSSATALDNNTALQQLAGKVAAYRRSLPHGWQQKPLDPMQAVQEGLVQTQQQLTRSLSQQGRRTQQDPGQQTTAQSTGAPATAVLQQLLQLAAGDAERPFTGLSSQLQLANNSVSTVAAATTLQRGHMGGAVPNKQCAPYSDLWGLPVPIMQQQPAQTVYCAAEQQRWAAAAHRALQLFDLHELERLPVHSLKQALLLQPELLQRILEAAAATVLQPVLQHRPVLATSSPISQQALDACSGCVSQVLFERHPCWRELPSILAGCPLLLMQASHVLLSWLECTGHQRLWQLLSVSCRPAWQAMAAAALQTSSVNQQQQNRCQGDAHNASHHLLLSGAFHLACPDWQQQQLVQVLVQQPSVEGLLQLLQLLPGCNLDGTTKAACVATSAAAEACVAAASTYSTSRTARPKSTMDGMNADQHIDDSDCPNLNWPTLQEWQGQAAAAMTAEGQQQGAETARGTAAATDLVTVVSAWRLVMQHRCWYEFACYLLVSCCLTHLQGHLQQPSKRRQQQTSSQVHGAVLPDDPTTLLQLALWAASFIAWVQEPADLARRQWLAQQLRSPLQLTIVGKQLQAGSGVINIGSAAKSAAMAEVSLPDICSCLLQVWKAAMHGHVPAAQAAACTAAGEAIDPLGSSQQHQSSSLVDVDLPIAVMQQQQLLLSCKEQEVLQLCFPALIHSMGQQQEGQQAEPSRQQSGSQHRAIAAEQGQQWQHAASDGRLHPAAQQLVQGQQGQQWQILQQQQRQPAKQDEQQRQGQPIEGTCSTSSNSASENVHAALCAVLDSLDVASRAAVDLLTVNIWRSTQCLPWVGLQGPLSPQQQQSSSTCNDGRWLAREWDCELSTGSCSSKPASVLSACIVVAGSQRVPSRPSSAAKQVMETAKVLARVATSCTRLVEKLLASAS